MPDPLDSGKLIRELPTFLPRSSSSPLPQPTDVVAALVHTIHLALEFRLITHASTVSSSGEALQPVESVQAGEEADIDDNASDTATAVENEEDTPAVAGTLPEGWNNRGEDTYTFEYRHDQSSMTFRVRVGKMGGRVQIDATAEDGAPNSLSVVLNDLVDSSTFPIPGRATAGDSAGPSSGSSSSEGAAKALGLKSISSVTDFVNRYKRDILSKLLPGLQMDGYTESSSGSGPRNPPPAAGSNQPARPRPHDPLLDPEHMGAGAFGRPHPASIGHDDLDPQGIHPGRLGPLAGPGSGGMYMDFNHPLFDGRRRGDPDLQGPGGSIQPPGARWDPVGPGSGGFPGGGNPLGGMGVGDGRRDRWGDELPPPGEFGPDLGMGGMGGIGGPRGGMGGGRGRGGFGGGPGGFGGMGGMGGGRGGGGFGGGGFGGGGGMFM